MLTNKILEEAKKHFEACEVVHFKRTTTPVSFESGRLKKVSQTTREGFALRAVRNGRMAYTATTKPGDYEGLIKSALETVNYAPAAEFAFAKEKVTNRPKITSTKTQKMTIDEMIELGKKSVAKLSGLHPKGKVGGGVSKSNFQVKIATSEGFEGTYKRDEFGWGAHIHLVDGDNMLSAGDGFTGVEMDESWEERLNRSINLFKLGMNNVKGKTGKYKVLFDPGAMMHAINILEASFNGKNVEKKVSPWANKVGEKIMDERISIIDDGLLKCRNFSAPFDDEGTPMQKTPIIEKGVLRGFLFDKLTASRTKNLPTGNGFKKAGFFAPPPDIETPPNIGHSTLVFSGGKSNYEKLLAQIEDGFYICDLLGTMMGNPLSGNLAGNIGLGYVVKKGEIVGRIKDAMISVNLFEALKNQVIDFSKDPEVGGWNGDMLLPYVLFDGCTVAIG